jgi:hypothetical protein
LNELAIEGCRLARIIEVDALGRLYDVIELRPGLHDSTDDLRRSARSDRIRIDRQCSELAA